MFSYVMSDDTNTHQTSTIRICRHYTYSQTEELLQLKPTGFSVIFVLGMIHSLQSVKLRSQLLLSESLIVYILCFIIRKSAITSDTTLNQLTWIAINQEQLYPGLCHAKWPWVDAEEKNRLGRRTICGDVLLVGLDSILKWIVHMSDRRRELNMAQYITQLQFQCQKLLSNCKANCCWHTFSCISHSRQLFFNFWVTLK